MTRLLLALAAITLMTASLYCPKPLDGPIYTDGRTQRKSLCALNRLYINNSPIEIVNRELTYTVHVVNEDPVWYCIDPAKADCTWILGSPNYKLTRGSHFACGGAQ